MELKVKAAKDVAKERFELKFGKKFITKSLRGQNYDSETALSELVDNSIDADSDHIEISFPIKSSPYNKITISDDGKGMSHSELVNAMTLGSDREYQDTEIGYFGIGMKASLAYLSERVIIRTKKSGDDYYTVLNWNIDEDTAFFIQSEKTKDIKESGTTIIIDCGWRYDHYSHTQESVILKKLGARYYHTLYVDKKDKNTNQVKITVNNKVVLPVDPMYRDSEQTISDYSNEVTYNDNKGDHLIKIKGFFLKNHSSEPNFYDIKGGRPGFSHNKQGVYVLYNNKYINLGGTYLGCNALHPELNYLRIELVIPKETTEYFGISMNKNSISDFLGDDKNSDSVKDKIKKSISEAVSWGLTNSKKVRNTQKSDDADLNAEAKKLESQCNNDIKSTGFTKNPLFDKDRSATT